MIILAADTSTSVNTVAVCDGGRPLAETVVDCGRKHSERLIETADWVLGQAELTLDDVDGLAISNGPGSFTGLRVGVAAWKGLALGKGLPLVAVPTLDAMTRLGVFCEGLVCPLLDARMGEVFGAVCRFQAGTRTKLSEDRVCPVESLIEGLAGRVFFLGDGATLYRARIAAKLPDAVFAAGPYSLPRAAAVAAEAAALLQQGVRADAALVAPAYLRKSQAEEQRRRAPGKAPRP